MGATIAALLAIPVPPDDLIGVTKRVFDSVIDYTLPVAGLAKGRRVARSVVAAAGERDIEDLWLPFLCTATNLTRARVEVLEHGDLVRAIRASVAIPGVFPPVPRDGDLLVDGGLLNNLPVDEVRRRHPTATIVAVDVAPPLGPRAKADYGVAVSGSGLLAKRMVPGMRPPPVPGLSATLLRSLVVSAVAERDRHVEEKVADLYLSLDLRGVGMLQFDAVAPVAERGYQAAREEVARWAATSPVA